MTALTSALHLFLSYRYSSALVASLHSISFSQKTEFKCNSVKNFFCVFWKVDLVQRALSRQYLEVLRVLGLHLSNEKTKQNISEKAWFQLLDSSTGASLRKLLSRHLREHSKKILLFNHFSLTAIFTKSSVIFHSNLLTSVQTKIMSSAHFQTDSKNNAKIDS